MKKYILSLLFLLSTQASAYTSLTVFGDSMFDGGNTDTAVISYYKLFGGGLTDPPYSNYRFTNGPTAVEYLATNLSLNDTGHFFNYAVGGATTADIFSGVSNLLSTNPVLDSQGLYVVNGGGNDFLGTNTAPEVAATNIIQTISALNAHGAKNFLVLSLPILGRSPAFNGAPQSTVTSLENTSLDFNSLLSTGISNLTLSANSYLTLFDTATVLAEGSASAAANGITNLTDACFTGAIVCANPDEYIFWDSLHLTTKVHAYLGEAMTQAVTAAVPEPETYAMLLAGLGFIGFSTRRKA